MLQRLLPLVVSFCLFAATPLLADPATPLTSLAKMPVKEITVFKDGHAFLLHSGKMPTDASGNVILDALPQPVLGTFWPYSADKNAKLTAVTASVRKIKLDRTALSLRELIEANIGAGVTITEIPIAPNEKDAQPIKYSATILSIPTQSGEELEAASPPNSGEKLPVKGNIVLVKTNTGIKAVSIDRIVDVTFNNPPATNLAHEEFRNLLTLKLDWGNKPIEKQADVGMLYLQKGIRWIPNYKVTIDGKGQATIRLQATLINELTDLDDVTANLVIGVPTFAFAATPDPMALQQTIAQLSQYFAQPGQLGNNFDNSNFAMSNSIMTQSARMGEVRQPAPQVPADLGPEVASQGKNEDLFLFQVKHVTLKKGQRMVLPVAEYALKYKDIYTLEIPITPPPEVMRAFDNARRGEVARLLNAPKAMHKIRLFNKADVPLTTAPAMIVSNDRVVAQGMMNYTAIGASFDLELTTAIDVHVNKSDEETKRIPDAEKWNKDTYMRLEMTGKINLTNYSQQPVELEVTRHLLGNLDTVDHDGKKEAVNLLEDATYAPTSTSSAAYPAWYGWYSWPNWWNRFNGVGKATWNLTLEPGKSAELGYTWHYFWR
jgi:hypothetical protein